VRCAPTGKAAAAPACRGANYRGGTGTLGSPVLPDVPPDAGVRIAAQTLYLEFSVYRSTSASGGLGFGFGWFAQFGDAACFIGAMKFVASQGGPKVPADATVTSTVGIGPRSAGGFGLDVELAVSLPGVAKADAEALVAKAHQVCPYSNATRGNIDVRLTVV